MKGRAKYLLTNVLGQNSLNYVETKVCPLVPIGNQYFVIRSLQEQLPFKSKIRVKLLEIRLLKKIHDKIEDVSQFSCRVAKYKFPFKSTTYV